MRGYDVVLLCIFAIRLKIFHGFKANLENVTGNDMTSSIFHALHVNHINMLSDVLLRCLHSVAHPDLACVCLFF